MNLKTLTHSTTLLAGAETVNDVHSKLNRTQVKRRLSPGNEAELCSAIKYVESMNESLSICGGRHAMGGQQFLTNGVLLDMTGLNKVLNFDRERGTIEVEAGMFWPDLIDFLQRQKSASQANWAINQKQTGADHLSIGGALSANIHGRGLSLPPFVNDIKSFKIILQNGTILRCSRDENAELFGLAIGGYGLFGIIASVTLQLVPRKSLVRTVEMVHSRDAISRLEACLREGAEYGDFQFAIDHNCADFLKTGIMSTYRPVACDSISTDNKLLSKEDWHELLFLAHTNKSAAFENYSRHYLKTSGQFYWSDTFQLATYLDDYHTQLDKRLSHTLPGSEMISELYVRRECLHSFLSESAILLKEQNANVIYGTVRLIEQETETFMPWAKDRFACVVLNLHVDHNSSGLVRAQKTFRDLIQLAIGFNGSYYLTYHRFATKDQVLACYPEMPLLFEKKFEYDPTGRFRSDWFDHHVALLEA